MVTETKKARVPNVEKARILRENGVYAYEWYEPGESMFSPLPMLCFMGDDKAGEKAVKILQDHGFPIGVLSREWTYSGYIDCQQVKWTLVV